MVGREAGVWHARLKVFAAWHGQHAQGAQLATGVPLEIHSPTLAIVGKLAADGVAALHPHKKERQQE